LDSDFGDLVDFVGWTHTQFTYHRTWETGLKAAIRVTAISPDFFSFDNGFEQALHVTLPSQGAFGTTHLPSFTIQATVPTIFG
jgi:hypothetical protein